MSCFVDSACDAVAKDYYSDVKELAKSIKDQIDAFEFSCVDDVLEHLNECVDGHSRVIYTHLARQCLLVSKSEESYLDNGVDLSLNDGIPWSQLAYFAFLEDVTDELRAITDLSDDNPAFQDDEPAL
jgi:hypothetical protein